MMLANPSQSTPHQISTPNAISSHPIIVVARS
jgi:hypothetical protein